MAEAGASQSSHELVAGVSSDASPRARANACEGWADVASMIASALTATASQTNHQAESRSHNAATSAEASARAGESTAPMPSHQVSAANSHRGAPDITISNAPAANWVTELEQNLRGPCDANRLITIWRENFLPEIKFAKDGVSLADIAWARAQQVENPAHSDRARVLERLNAALRSRVLDDALRRDWVLWLTDPAILSKASQLAWFVALEEHVTHGAIPSPYPPHGLDALWAKLKLSPIDGSAQFDATQLAYREFSPVGTPWRYAHLPIADALPFVFGTTDLLAFESRVAAGSDAIVADRAHMCHELWHVLLFHRYVRQLSGVSFTDRYLVLSHQLPENKRLSMRRCEGGRPRRPVLVRACGKWFVHHIALVQRQGVWIADPERPPVLWTTSDVHHAIVTWMCAMRDYFQWQLETGEVVEEFLASFVPPP